MNVRRLLFATGTRADWGKLRVLWRAAEAEGVECHALVTGMHLVARTGYTASDVEADVDAPARVWRHANGIERADLAASCASTTDAARNVLMGGGFDAVVVHGDRIEALAVATAAASAGVPIIHVEGGERSGAIDDRLRYAVTALADLHLVANAQAVERIGWLRRGGVHEIGSPEADVMASPSTWPTLADVCERYGLGQLEAGTFGVFIAHAGESREDAFTVMETARLLAMADGRHWVALEPNADAGGERLSERLREAFGVLVPSMRQEMFFRLLSCAAVVVGNSSALVRECPALGVPSVVIGNRQRDRVAGLGLESVRETAGRLNVLEAVSAEWGKRYAPRWPFGGPGAGERFAAALRSWDWRVT